MNYDEEDVDVNLVTESSRLRQSIAQMDQNAALSRVVESKEEDADMIVVEDVESAPGGMNLEK